MFQLICKKKKVFFSNIFIFIVSFFNIPTGSSQTKSEEIEKDVQVMAALWKRSISCTKQSMNLSTVKPPAIIKLFILESTCFCLLLDCFYFVTLFGAYTVAANKNCSAIEQPIIKDYTRSWSIFLQSNDSLQGCGPINLKRRRALKWMTILYRAHCSALRWKLEGAAEDLT